MEPNSRGRLTLREIARRVGVSHTTVSRALRNDPRITPVVRDRIQRKARELGYRPDPMLAALAQYRRTKNPRPIGAALAWINCWPDPKQLRSHREFDLYWRGARTEAERCGFRLEEFIIGPDLTTARLQDILLTRAIRGILLPPVGGITVDWGGFDWSQFCIVRFGYSIENPPAHLVTSDQLADGLIAYENMWRLGYRRIGFVTRPEMKTHFRAGYLLGELQLNPDNRIPPLIAEHSPGNREEPGLLRAWIREHRPDAILTEMPEVPDWLRQEGFRVPEDIGLATLSILDGNADAGIDQNSLEIGITAVQFLVSLINANRFGVPGLCRKVLIEGRWVDGSTLPPKSADLSAKSQS